MILQNMFDKGHFVFQKNAYTKGTVKNITFANVHSTFNTRELFLMFISIKHILYTPSKIF